MILREILDFYSLYDKPETLPGYDKAYDTVPELAWQKILGTGPDLYPPRHISNHQLQQLKDKEYLWAQNPQLAYKYALCVKQSRFIQGEKAIVNSGDSALCVQYATYVLKRRFPEAEKVIARNAGASFRYAYDIIKGRWEKGEKAISTDPQLAAFYAVNIVKNPNFWKNGEHIIGDKQYWKKHKY